MLKKLKKLAKDLLAISFVRKLYELLNKGLLGFFASNRLVATLYSILGLLTFNREQYAVLRGRRNYYANLKLNRKTHVELRRNIHRLEKAMIMQPRRPIFAKDYIGETLDFYEQSIRQLKEDPASLDESELQWAHDVLGQYFQVVKQGVNKAVDEAKLQYVHTLSSYNPSSEVSKSPYARQDSAASDVSYDSLLSLSMRRRSVRWFQKKKVPRSLLDKALMVARQAPTACNRLPYEFKIYDDPELAKEIAAIPFGTTGYSHQVPVIVVLVGKLSSYFSPRDRHAIYVDTSLAAMSFAFALETLGLSSSMINWPDFEPLEIKMQKKLGLDSSDRVIMLMAVGYADPKGGIPYSQKKDLSVLRSYNEIIKK